MRSRAKRANSRAHIQLQTSESAAQIFAAEQPKLAEDLWQSGVKLVNSDLLSGQQWEAPATGRICKIQLGMSPWQCRSPRLLTPFPTHHARSHPAAALLKQDHDP